MTKERLQRLLPVAKAKYEAEYAQIKHLFVAEAQYRAQLARLSELDAEVRQQATTFGPMQMLGADVLFRKNLDRNRALLNSELAKVMALKLQAMGKVRKAFGRKHAIEIEEQRLTEEAKREREKRQRDAALVAWQQAQKTRT